MSLGLIPLGTRPLGLAPNASGGASYTLVCAPGAYSLTGVSAGLVASHRMATAQGAYALTGNPAALTNAHKLAAATGAYVINGNPATLTYAGLTMPAAGGSYVITGSDASMLAAHRLVAEAGSYAITGSAVVAPGEAAPPVGMMMGAAGSSRETRKFADLLDKARPTKAAKKRLRRVLEAEALELLPDEPAAIQAASVIAQVIAKKEIQAIERRPADAAPLESLPFDPSAEIARMVAEWMENEALRQQIEDEEDEFEVALLLMG